MDRFTKVAALAAALLVAAPACGKKDKDDNKKAGPTAKTVPDKPAPPKEPPPPAKKTGQELAKIYQDCWGHVSAKAWDKFKTCYTADATSEWLDSGMPVMNGRDAIIEQGAKPFMTAFPDWKGTPQLIVVGGNKVFSIAHVSGTHEGVLKTPKGDVPATKKKMGLLVAHGVQFNEQGEATKEWFLQDFGTLAGQLGLHKMPVRPAMEKGWTETAEVVIATDEITADKVPDQLTAALDAWNKHDAKAIDGYMSDDFAQYVSGMPGDTKGKKEAAATAQGYWTAFPDVKLTTDSTLSAGDYTVAIGSATGTHKGPLGPLKATGKTATVKTIQFAKWKDGKMVAEWVFYNNAALMEQLGVK
jgi:steroid delta-isomerase-like uncharacterized protein